MQALKSFTTPIKSRGQLTIPKQIRNARQLDEGQVVSTYPYNPRDSSGWVISLWLAPTVLLPPDQ